MTERQYVWIVVSRVTMALDSDMKIEGVRSSEAAADRLMRQLFPDAELHLGDYLVQDEWGDTRKISIRRWEVL